MDEFAASAGVFLLSKGVLNAFAEFLLDPHDCTSICMKNFDGKKWELKHSLFDYTFRPYWFLIYKPIQVCLNLGLIEFSNEREWWEDSRAGPGLGQKSTEEVVAHMHTLIKMLDEADPAATVDTVAFKEREDTDCNVDVFFACKPSTAAGDVVNPLAVVTKRLGWLRLLHSPFYDASSWHAQQEY
jgi:hypothetical protein